MPSLADAATAILAANVPVLFLDTCSILDVIRAPSRGMNGCVEAALELYEMATDSPIRCMLIAGSFVPAEWQDHDQGELADLITHLEKMEEAAGHFHGLCGHLGVTFGFGVPQYVRSGIAERLHDLSRKLRDSALILDQHTDVVQRAYNRVAVTKRRQSRKGGQLKDCTIFEEYLEVCRLLGAGGFVERILTVVQTCRLHGKNTLEFLYNAVHNHRSGLSCPCLLS